MQHAGKMRRSLLLRVLVSMIAECAASTGNPFDDGLLHNIQWSPEVEEETMNGIVSEDSLYMRTNNDERYVCRIPDGKREAVNEKVVRSDGLTPADLLAPLITSGQCVYEVQAYWTYEYCPGRELRQYHEEQVNRKRKRTAEYILGQQQTEASTSASSSSEQSERKKIPKYRLGEKDYPYYSIELTGGTSCDVTGLPRRSEVLFVCEEQAGRAQLLTIKETRSCEYEAVVATSLLCANPLYQSPREEVRNIQCFAAEGSPDKPQSQVAFERELETSNQGSQRRTVHVVIGDKETIMLEVNEQGTTTQSKPNQVEESPENPTVNFLTPNADEADHSSSQSTKEAPQDSHRNVPLKSDLSIIRQFLAGQFCLHGGQGWWRYEFCYGRHVLQYHQEPNSRKRVQILLGQWDLAAHQRWFASMPTKKKLPRKAVVHQYFGGDMCDVTGKPRVVSVRLRCVDFENVHQVSMYLEEPSTCVYMLTVESKIVCDLLESVDADGLLHLKD